MVFRRSLVRELTATAVALFLVLLGILFTNLVLRLLATDEVLVHPGYFFDFPRESFLVVSLLPPPAAFSEAVARVLRHFDCTVRRP